MAEKKPTEPNDFTVTHGEDDFEEAVSPPLEGDGGGTTYFTQRIITEMRLLPEHYTVKMPDGTALPLFTPGEETGTDSSGLPKTYPLINIHFCTPDGHQCMITQRKKPIPATQKRYKELPPNVKDKYKHEWQDDNGGDKDVFPFFPPAIVDAFRKQEKLPYLVITEGPFKAAVACANGIPCIALPGITQHRQPNTDDTLNTQIARVIDTCKPARIIILWDGDCRNISTKALNSGEDIRNRPWGFRREAGKLRSRIHDTGYRGEIFFATPKTDELGKQGIAAPHGPKGLDDLVLALPNPEEITTDLLSEKQMHTGQYFWKTDIGFDLQQLDTFFCTRNETEFYEQHRALIGFHPFIFNGSKFKFDEKEMRVKLLFHKDVNDFLRVGGKYFQLINKPDAYGFSKTELIGYPKEEIKADFGKDVFEDIRKLKQFVCIPDHFAHQRYIDDCYNLYHPFTHLPKECDMREFEKSSATFKYIRHVMGANTEGMPDHVDIFLDWMKLKLEQPTVKLPMICLVSRERKTGKSTMLEWNGWIWGDNMTVLGNMELEDKFNENWASKGVVGIDEALFETDKVMERLKMLMTRNTVTVRRMQTAGTDQDFFAGFMLTSNNVDRFLKMAPDEDRFWIRYVYPFPGEEDVEMKPRMREEIPQFVYYLLNRKMAYPTKRSRFWFPRDTYHTRQTQRLIENSKPVLQIMLEETLENELHTLRESEEFRKEEIFSYSMRELIELIGRHHPNDRPNFSKLRWILQQFAGYPPEIVSTSYKLWQSVTGQFGDSTITCENKNGRAYHFSTERAVFEARAKEGAEPEDHPYNFFSPAKEMGKRKQVKEEVVEEPPF